MTDTIQDGKKHRVPTIFMAGPIKHWWTCWGSGEHYRYQLHRAIVRDWLIQAGYLTYAPWDAFKGTWDERAQHVNEYVIRHSDLFANLTPDGIPAEETEHEQKIAQHYGVLVCHVKPVLTRKDLFDFLTTAIGPGVPYEQEDLERRTHPRVHDWADKLNDDRRIT